MKITAGSKPILFGTLGLVGIGAYSYTQSSNVPEHAQALNTRMERAEHAEYEGSGDLYEGSGQDTLSSI